MIHFITYKMFNMKNAITLMSLFLAGLIPFAGNSQELVCINGLTVQLNPFGEFILYPSDIDGGSSGYESYSLDQDTFTCADVGDNIVTMTATESNGNTNQCTVLLIVEDNISPVAVCDIQTLVQLDANGNFDLTPSMIDDGSYDVCSEVTISIFPSSIHCGDPNPTQVVLVAADEYGNTNSCVTFVSYTYPPAAPVLACNDEIQVSMYNGQPVSITPEMMLEGGPYNCIDNFVVTLTVNGSPISGNTLYPEHVGQNVVAMITDPISGNSCWGQVVIENVGCAAFFICDTQCHSTEVTDCNGGHADNDNVEWPCDIHIPTYFDISENSPTPAYLISQGYASAADASPQVLAEDCHITAHSYWDQVFNQSTGYLIVRTWTVIEWTSNVTAQYSQIITINSQLFNVCDTLPWNTPAADCASGHTFDDDVEWPANDTIFDFFVHPVQLESNPDVHPNNVRPEVTNNEVPFQLNYEDDVEFIADDTAIVHRTWTLSEGVTNQSYNYLQDLYVFTDLTQATGCAFREDGEPIEDVFIVQGQSTDESGCTDIDVIQGIELMPIKSGDIQEGVDIIDKVLMMEHVLGISQLTPYQMLAADINNSKTVTTLDVVLLEQIISGDYTQGPVWSFYNADWQFLDSNGEPLNNPLDAPLPDPYVLGDLPLAYNYVGVKKGDIDNSYSPDSQPLTGTVIDVHMMDEILNNGEEYEVFMYSKKTLAIQGIDMELSRASTKIRFDAILSETLPGFNAEEHVTLTDDKISIRYTVPLAVLQSGQFSIPQGQPILKFQLTAKDNGILSKEFALASNNRQYMKVSSFNAHVGIKLIWDEQLTSGVKDYSLTGVSIYPNPAREVVQVSAIGYDLSDLEYQISNIQGSLVATGRVGAEGRIDLNTVPGGFYLLKLEYKDGKTRTEKLVVQR